MFTTHQSQSFKLNPIHLSALQVRPEAVHRYQERQQEHHHTRCASCPPLECHQKTSTTASTLQPNDGTVALQIQGQIPYNKKLTTPIEQEHETRPIKTLAQSREQAQRAPAKPHLIEQSSAPATGTRREGSEFTLAEGFSRISLAHAHARVASLSSDVCRIWNFFLEDAVGAGARHQITAKARRLRFW